MSAAPIVQWVADKTVDWKRVRALLDLSEQDNHWSNFGPVSLLLEERIAEIMGLNSSLRVVATSSGTSALDALSALEEHKMGRAPRWVVSSFGFRCSHLGPFRDAQIVDCDDQAMLDLDLLDAIDPATYDAILVTNVFGTMGDITPFADLARMRNRLLVIDSAAAFDSAHRSTVPFPSLIEAFSFHHTKPWGFGEGGAMVVDAEDVGIARSVVNFGLVSNRPIAAVATNAKMSDVTAAFIVSWLDSVDELRDKSQEQFERVRAIAATEGWATLGDSGLPPFGVPPCVTLVGPDPIELAEFDDAPFVCRKYYEPLANTSKAMWLFERMLNVPCHPDMAKLNDAQIRQALAIS